MSARYVLLLIPENSKHFLSLINYGHSQSYKVIQRDIERICGLKILQNLEESPNKMYQPKDKIYVCNVLRGFHQVYCPQYHYVQSSIIYFCLVLL